MTDDEIPWEELGTDAGEVYAALLKRADEVLAQLDERGRAIAAIEARSRAMEAGQRWSPLRRS